MGAMRKRSRQVLLGVTIFSLRAHPSSSFRSGYGGRHVVAVAAHAAGVRRTSTEILEREPIAPSTNEEEDPNQQGCCGPQVGAAATHAGVHQASTEFLETKPAVLSTNEEGNPSQQRHRQPRNLSSRYASVDFVTVDSPRLNFRALGETTRDLLKKKIGEWNRKSFKSCCQCMESWSRGNSKRAALNVERLMRRVVEEQMVGNPYADQLDMTALYTILILAWANSGEQGGAERAEEILDYLQDIHDKGESEDPLLCGPGLESFNAVIHAYARAGRHDAPDQAMRVLQKLYDWNRSKRTFAAPDKETYAAVLRAFARRENGPELILNMLNHMELLSLTYPLVKPDYRCHNAYLYALLEAINRGDMPGPKGAKMAEAYLHNMMANPDEEVTPCQWSFNMVLSTWSRSGAYDMVDRAEALMHELEEFHERSGRPAKTQPNSYSYNALMSCYSRSRLLDKGERTQRLLRKMQRLAGTGENPAAEPDTVSFNIVMNAWAKSGHKSAPSIVEKLLCELNDLYEATGDWRRKPNARSINTCLDAWAKSGLPRSAERIRDWIDQMHSKVKSGESRIAPDKWAYNAYLQALSKSGTPDVAETAEGVLAEMERLYEAGGTGLKPDVRTFTNVIHCIALSGSKDAVERAMGILNRMEAGDVRPSLYTFNCVINTIAKSKRPGKALLALKMLRRMQAVALRPQTVSYNNVLNACAFSSHPGDMSSTVLDIAMSVLRECQDGPGANWISYQTAIRVICTYEQNPKLRWQRTRDVFHQCCDDGQLTGTVLGQVRYAVSEGEYHMLKDEATNHQTMRLRPEFTVNARRSMLDRKTKTVAA